MNFRVIVLIAFCLPVLPARVFADDINLARDATVTASSKRGQHTPGKAADGVVADDSQWIPGFNETEAWLELSFSDPTPVGAIDIYTGWKHPYVLTDFDIKIESGGKWISPEAGKIRGHRGSSIHIELDDRPEAVTKIRLVMINPDSQAVREIAVYAETDTLGLTGLEVKDGVPTIDRDAHQIALNQVGYLPDQPKRFTAPLSPDGSKFVIRKKQDDIRLFSGTITNHLGDFSDFKPASSNVRYVVEVSFDPLKTLTSHPFLISETLYEDQYWQPAVDFLIDSRSVVGTHASAYGGCPWRDGTYYDAIVPALAIFYAANPELIESMPKQIDWKADSERITDRNFQLTTREKKDFGALYAAKSYYRLEPPSPDAPDVVKLIHWGTGWYLVNPATHDPSSDPLGRDIHPQTVEQVSYVLWAWPLLKRWLPQSFYDQCHDFVFTNWDRSMEIDPLWDPATYETEEEMDANDASLRRHPFKGRHAPGHSIVPNLILHEVAKRDRRSDADQYLDAAVRQADWIIKNLDWNEPRTTKGHRMSEHRTIPNLVWLLQNYPERAPQGLREKITEWAEVAISRSDNLWDFRRYDLDQRWTIPSMNELGNSLCLPAIMLSATWVIEDSSLNKRLRELAYASIDHVFGRNPRLAAAVGHPENGFPEIEQGWPRKFPDDRCARLETCRGTITSLPGSEMYPFSPDGLFRHPEGWVNYGAAWCISLAYLEFDREGATTAVPER